MKITALALALTTTLTAAMHLISTNSPRLLVQMQQDQQPLTDAEVEDSSIYINEIQVANIDMFIDPSYNYGGWVEIHNPASKSVSLSGLYVSDDPDSLQKCKLPTNYGLVTAKGNRCVWFDHYAPKGDLTQSDVAFKQVPFRLNPEGGIIIFSNTAGEIIASQTYPPAIARCSYARITDGSDTWAYCSTPTPAKSNNGSSFASVQLPPPVVNLDATVYTNPLQVQVTIPEGATLRYTTNGSTPTLSNGSTSTDGIFQVSNTTRVYRFRLFQDGKLPSAVVTRTYIYRTKDYYLPIVSVVTDQKNLYDNTIGAYTDGTNGISGNNKDSSNKNRNWERPVNFEYLVPDDDGGSFLMALNQECDFEVCGGWSRHFSPASSFRLKGAKYYLGNNYFPYPVFKDKPFIKNKVLQIRNGGNDNNCRIRDAAIHQMVIESGFYLDCQACQPAHIFINGTYKFMFNIREPNNKNLGYSNYGIDNDEMDQFEINGSKGYQQKTGDDVAFRRWMTLAQQLAADPTNEGIYQEICELVDIDEYTNYMAAECYIGSGDWLTNSNNVKGFRARDDGKFHLVMMDVDAGFGSTSMLSNLSGSLNDSRYDTRHNFLIEIFLNMLKHAGFKRRFVDAYSIVNASVFTPERAKEVTQRMASLSETALSFDGQSPWNSANSLANSISSTSNRLARMNTLRSYLGLSNPYIVSLSSNLPSARLLLNGQEIPQNYFSGNIYPPATLKAQAPAGYRFTGWKADGVFSASETTIALDDTWQYYDQGSLDGKSWKAASYNTSGWKSGTGPFGYGTVGIEAGKGDYNTTIDYGSNSSQKRPTYYFRKTVKLNSTPTADDIYRLTYYVDDGCIIYVNGTEVERYHMPDGTPTYNTYSTTYEGSQAYSATITLDNALLHAGENIIAVEVHNTSASSSDIFWGATLLHDSSAAITDSAEITLDDLGTTGTYGIVAQFERIDDAELLAELATPVKVNEVSAGNSVFIGDAFKKNDWLELFNPTDTDLDAAGLYLSDDLNDPFKFQIPIGSALNTIIPAQGHLILWADKLEPVSQLHTNFKLGNEDDQMVLVTSSDEFVTVNKPYFDKHPSLRTFADALIYVAHKGDESVGRYPDGSNTFYRMTRPTIQRQNALHSYDEAVGTDEGIMQLENFELAMDEGWNWMSYPLDRNLEVNTFADHVRTILSQSEQAVRNEKKLTFNGSLQTIASNQLYKMDLDAPATYTFKGRCPEKNVISLLRGWNWIGYSATGAQTLSDALRNTTVDHGDIIMSQHGFSIYSVASGWLGTLSSFVPGEGYLYKARRNKNLIISQPKQELNLRRRIGPRAIDRRNGIDPNAYPDAMGIIATILLDGESVDPERFELTAYAGDECRGAAEVAANRLFILLYGQGGEEITFRVTERTDGSDEGGQAATVDDGDTDVTYSVEETFTFDADVLGSVITPTVLHITSVHTAVQPPVHTEVRQPAGFYTLSGLYLGTDRQALQPGTLYIVHHADGSARKLLLRR